MSIVTGGAGSVEVCFIRVGGNLVCSAVVAAFLVVLGLGFVWVAVVVFLGGIYL